MGCFGSSKTADPKTADPLFGPEAQKFRSEVFGYLPEMRGAANAAAGAAVDATQRGAAAFAPVGEYGRRVLAGTYLQGNPALDRAMGATRTASNTAARNVAANAASNLQAQQAATRSQFGRAGQTFGTTNQLAQEGASAALQAQIGKQNADRVTALDAAETQARAENYARERQYQMAAPGIISAAATTPAQMMQAIPGLMYSGTTPAVDIARALSGGGGASSTQVYRPGFGDYALQTAGVLGAAGLM